MNTYTPNRWIMLKFTELKTGRITYKILAGWLGGYTGSDSWKLSSGTESIEETEHYFLCPQFSGSTYKLVKDLWGTSRLTMDILNEFADELEAKPGFATMEALAEGVIPIGVLQ